MKNWKALKNEWTAIIVAHRDDPGRCRSQLDRLVRRWDGNVEAEGLGFIHLSSESFAQVGVDALALFVASDEPEFEAPVAEIYAEDAA